MATQQPTVADTSPSDWKYVAEGGATIVFSYCGSHLAFSGEVLRLRKIRLSNLKMVERLDDAPHNSNQSVDDPTIQFQDRVMSRLLSPTHLPRLRSVKVDRVWLDELHDRTDASRPHDRRVHDRIDWSKERAVLATDLIGGTRWAVEIKPKWAFLPNPAHLSKETKYKKTHYCRHCMHAALNRSRGGAAAIGYCPLDLFSGDELRVRRALSALWQAWVSSRGAVNNLRLFAHDQVIDPSDAASVAVLGKAFRLQPSASLDDLQESFVAELLPRLLGTRLLRDLSHLQRTLDPLDLEGLTGLWRSVYGASSSITASDLFPEPDVTAWEAFVDSYLDSSFQAQLDHNSPDGKHLEYYCKAYLLSATFKDCSIIISKRDGDAEGNITAIDLDVKDMHRLQKWQALDREIVDNFDATSKAPCINVNK